MLTLADKGGREGLENTDILKYMLYNVQKQGFFLNSS